LAVGRSHSVFFANQGITDVEGNLLGCTILCNFSFTTGQVTDTVGPNVLGVSPADKLSGVPINAQVVIQFDEPIDRLTLNQVSLSGGSGTVNVIATLTNGNQTLTLTPVVPLAASTLYTLTIGAVQDLSGVLLATPVTTTFTTGTGVDLIAPQVVQVSPANGATGVPTNAVMELKFSKRIDPLTVGSGTFLVGPQSTGIPIGASITVSADGLTATLTPSSPLAASTAYFMEATGITDLVGQGINFVFISFTTAAGTETVAPTVTAVSPPNGATGVPV
jgi:hypothetical protein